MVSPFFKLNFPHSIRAVTVETIQPFLEGEFRIILARDHFLRCKVGLKNVEIITLLTNPVLLALFTAFGVTKGDS